VLPSAQLASLRSEPAAGGVETGQSGGAPPRETGSIPCAHDGSEPSAHSYAPSAPRAGVDPSSQLTGCGAEAALGASELCCVLPFFFFERVPGFLWWRLTLARASRVERALSAQAPPCCASLPAAVTQAPREARASDGAVCHERAAARTARSATTRKTVGRCRAASITPPHRHRPRRR
jgi:hypothetical protein